MTFLKSNTLSFFFFALLIFFNSSTLYAQCDDLLIDISAPFLEKGGDDSHYHISYCNKGINTVNDAIVEVTIDPELTVLNSSITHKSISGNVYTFDVGDLDADECGDFTIKVAVKTSAFASQTHCTQAKIYPDAGCTTSWTGAIIEAEAICLGTTIDFDLTNVGSTNSPTLAYSIFEEDIMVRTGSVQLNSLASTTISQEAAQGLTYRIVVQQDPAYPSELGGQSTTVFVENCNTAAGSSISSGYGLQFSNGNSAPNIAVDCQENVSSYAANTISSQPAGYGSSNYIYDHTELDYKIVFQNTGTTTATNLTITQSIDSDLDESSLIMGASSHDYTWSIVNGELEISFDNISLPTSSSDEMGSLGFVRFRIAQNSNANGTIITADADIKFDSRAAINTGSITHTVDENFEILPPAKSNIATPQKEKIKAPEYVADEEVTVNVYPNPFVEQVNFELAGTNYQQFTLHLYDVNGRLLKTLTSEERVLQLFREQLNSGMYIYRLFGDDKLLKTGKLVAQ